MSNQNSRFLGYFSTCTRFGQAATSGSASRYSTSFANSSGE